MNRNFRRPITARAVTALACLLSLLTLGSCASRKAPPQEPVTVEKGLEVELVDNVGCRPGSGHLRRTTGVDHVRWYNPTTVARKIYFKDAAQWPFIEPKADILVQPGARTEWFSISSTAAGDYEYAVDPPLTGTGVGPDEPVLTVGD